jgi:peptidoglycan hydrolase-like protein with peptidoglycan-binding domain
VARGRWVEVEDLSTTYAAGEACVVLRLADGRRSTIPVRVLDVDREELVRTLQSHLQRGHGLRRL